MPEPLPLRFVVRANCCSVNVAVTVLAAVIVTTHAPVPVHAPDHPANVDPVAGVAVTVTCVP